MTTTRGLWAVLAVSCGVLFSGAVHGQTITAYPVAPFQDPNVTGQWNYTVSGKWDMGAATFKKIVLTLTSTDANGQNKRTETYMVVPDPDNLTVDPNLPPEDKRKRKKGDYTATIKNMSTSNRPGYDSTRKYTVRADLYDSTGTVITFKESAVPNP